MALVAQLSDVLPFPEDPVTPGRSTTLLAETQSPRWEPSQAQQRPHLVSSLAQLGVTGQSSSPCSWRSERAGAIWAHWGVMCILRVSPRTTAKAQSQNAVQNDSLHSTVLWGSGKSHSHLRVKDSVVLKRWWLKQVVNSYHLGSILFLRLPAWEALEFWGFQFPDL